MGTGNPQYQWTKVELYGNNNSGNPIRFTIADGVSVSANTVLYLTEDREASGAALGTAAVAGVAAMDKEYLDGSTSISVYTDGVFLATASFAVTAGNPICMDSLTPNTVMTPATASLGSGAITIGYALDTIAANTRGNIRLRL
jgi:hypothetical protein